MAPGLPQAVLDCGVPPEPRSQGFLGGPTDALPNAMNGQNNASLRPPFQKANIPTPPYSQWTGYKSHPQLMGFMRQAPESTLKTPAYAFQDVSD